MRGPDERQTSLFILGDIESMIQRDDPLRGLRVIIDTALVSLDKDFAGMYAEDGRPSIAPEQLIRALLLQMVESIRSEAHLVRSIRYNVLYRWFVGLGATDQVWDASTFSKNRERMMKGDIAARLLEEVVVTARSQGLISDEHLTADGTHIKACASMKSFRQKDGDDPPAGGGRNASVDFHGTTRSNDTHASTTDPDAKLMKKSSGDASRLVHAGHVLTENRNGLVVDAQASVASGRAERETTLTMLERRPEPKRRCTLGADKGYDSKSFVEGCRAEKVTPHVAAKIKGSALDKRTTGQPGYVISQRKRKLVEEVFGWMKTIAGLAQTKFCGTDRVDWQFTFAAAAYNMTRIRNLTANPLSEVIC